MAQVEIRKADGRRIESFSADVDAEDAAAAVGLLRRWAKTARRDVGGLAIAVRTPRGAWREYRA